ncbi:hypothetical protein MycrhDRAFT_5767 [Mycolicibacterium rhodesiae JS60]|nr:hypothetical protein MycrhDRAFT_5767 [Mycolicibacterium rhodesiae JS60]
MTESVLQEAERLINGDRQQTYGEAIKSFERIADLWSAYIGGVSLTAMDVANLMALLKISRAKSALDTPEVIHRDSYVDGAGYLALAVRCYEEIWASQAHILDAEVVEPRVWEQNDQVPKGESVTVIDSRGIEFTRDHEHAEYLLYPVSGDYVQPRAPFTEVL